MEKTPQAKRGGIHNLKHYPKISFMLVGMGIRIDKNHG